MATKYKWTTADRVSSEILTELIKSSSMSLRSIEEKTQGEITYSRIFDIKKQRRTPVRLSEFITLCQACDTDSVEMFEKIIAEVKHTK